MRQFTTPEQTAKLIKLGFEKPKITFTFKLIEHNDVKTDIDIPVSNYSIGELIEMLPTAIEIGDGYALSIYHNRAEWMVSYDDNGVYLPIYSTEKDELIDALYDMLVKLKEG